MSEISKEILNTIEKERIIPKPRYVFLIERSILWVFVFIALVLGGLSVGVLCAIVHEHDFNLYSYLEVEQQAYTLSIIPYFWIIAGILFAVLAYVLFRKTERGYRFRMLLVASVVFSISLVTGAALFVNGVGSQLHHGFYDTVPFYKDIVSSPEEVWEQPERGLLSGIVTIVNNNEDFLLKDEKNVIWHVEFYTPQFIGFVPVIGERVKLFGVAYGENEFFAEELRNWNTL